MNSIIQKTKSFISIKPSNAFLLFLTGFLFSLLMLVNTLYSKHPHGGWETGMGVFTTASIFNVLLIAFCICAFLLYRSFGISFTINKSVSST